MKRNFTKKDLHTGDIIENRAGERGVVILEMTASSIRRAGWIFLKRSLQMICSLMARTGPETS